MAQVTITIPDTELPRLFAAFGRKLSTMDPDGKARNATAAEIRAWIIADVKAVVQETEEADARNAAVAAAKAAVPAAPAIT